MRLNNTSQRERERERDGKNNSIFNDIEQDTNACAIPPRSINKLKLTYVVYYERKVGR